MPVVVEALSKEDYAKWVAEQKGETTADASLAAGSAETQTDAVASDAAPAQAAADREWAMDELMAKGEQVYGQHCVACHQPNGQGVPPTFPALNGGVISTGPVDAHIDIVMHGKAGTAMAAFGAQLNDEDIAAVITYERNAWDNKVGDMVQPAAIKALR